MDDAAAPNTPSKEDALTIQTSDPRLKPIEEVFQILKCDRNGLSKQAGDRRLRLLGYNTLEGRKVYVILYLWVLTNESKFPKFLGFMWNPLLWVLKAAATMAIVTSILGVVEMLVASKPTDWMVFVGILILLLMNSGISLIEEVVPD